MDVWTKEFQFVLDVHVLCDGVQVKVDEYFFGNRWMNIYSCALTQIFIFSTSVSLVLILNFGWSYSCALFVFCVFS
jgi:hypothetical protein